MPLLFYGPGGSGGGSGYKYQSEDVAGLSYSRNADGSLTLNWTDPEDGGPAAEWKGTVVVCKEGEPPKSVDDGEIVCESVVRNQYKDAGLVLDVGGPGYYYGVFPYTKDYVVNADESNTVYVLSEGYKTLEDASWADVAHISSSAGADRTWSVRDEKKIVLSGAYNMELVFQIAGFNHDDLTGGGKAGITFVSKQVIGDSTIKSACWPDTDLGKEMDAVYSSFPDSLKKAVKTVDKKYLSGYPNTYAAIQTKVFVPAIREVAADYIDALSSGRGFYPDEGSQYDIFKGGEAKRVRENTNEESTKQYWWTRSAKSNATPFLNAWYMIGKNGTVYESAGGNRPFCIAFCI